LKFSLWLLAGKPCAGGALKRSVHLKNSSAKTLPCTPSIALRVKNQRLVAAGGYQVQSQKNFFAAHRGKWA
jgi:hypothetical protein